MKLPLYILSSVVGIGLAGLLAWRLASRRRSIPCPVWLGWMVELDNPFTKANRAAAVIDQLQVHPGMSVLDLGCGPGRITIPLGRAVGEQGRVVAVDIQPRMLDRARDKVSAAGLQNITLLHAGAGEGKLGKTQFDRAVLVTVLGEIPNRAAALQEVLQSLKPGGLLAVTEVIFDPHFQPRRTVQQLVGAAGFRQRSFFGSRLAFTMVFEKPN